MSLSPLESSANSSGPYILAIIRDVSARNRVEALAEQLLGQLSGELPLAADATTVAADISLERRVPLEEAQPAALTAREREVLGLLVAGQTNRQIAKELNISLSTVKTHVEHVMNKLGVSARTQAAVRAVELGLLSAE